MTEEFMIITNFDQAIEIDDQWILDRVDELIQEGIEKKDATIPLNACRQLVQISRLSGVALAKAIWLLREHWDDFNYKEPDEEGDFWEVDFNEKVYDYLGYAKATIDRYIQVWDIHCDNTIPEKHREAIRQRNIKDQIPIAKAVAQGYEIEDETWEELAYAPDFNTVGKIIREDVKGKPPRKGSLQIYINDEGTITAFQDDAAVEVGYLRVGDTENVMIKRTIERITKNAGIMRR